MTDPFDASEIGAKFTVNALTELFKKSIDGLKKAGKWLQDKNAEYDILNSAAEKYKNHLEERYNFVRTIGMTKPIPISNIFTPVCILEKPNSTYRRSIDEMLQHYNPNSRVTGFRIETKDGVDIVNDLSKVFIYGKPGAGKTTFLKYIALQAANGHLKEHRIPILIGLHDWADSNASLMECIEKQFDICQIPNCSLFIQNKLENGECILLFDSLDEVGKEKKEKIANEIRDFSIKYKENKFLITCRTGLLHPFEKFIDVELADFRDTQIKNFIDSWFGAHNNTANLFWKQLNANPAIKELASVPLLLTLLCLAFEETHNFPQNRAGLYEEAIDALLKKWDTSREIMRGDAYGSLSLKRRENMFAHIAASTFENSEYFLPQSVLEKYITDFVENLTNKREENLDIDGETILKSIEWQNGIFIEKAKRIYAFSHLTFQEYFTAKYIVINAREGTLAALVEKHLTDDRWREVILLTTGMLTNADNFLLLIKRKADNLLDDLIRGALKKINELIVDLVKQGTQEPRDSLNDELLITTFYVQLRALIIARSITQAIDGNPHPARTRALKLALSHAVNISNFLDNNFLGEVAINIDLDINDISSHILENYLKANMVLVNCIKMDAYITRETRLKLLGGILSSASIY